MKDVEQPKLSPEKLKLKKSSENLRNDEKYSDEAILHSALQIIYKRGGHDAKKAMKLIIDGDGDLDSLREFLDSTSNPAPLFRHQLFARLADTCGLSNYKVLQSAEIFREEFGRNSIEPNLKEFMDGYGRETAPYFDVLENVEFDIYVPDPEKPKKKIIVQDKRNLGDVYLPYLFRF